jgi:transposase
VIVIGIDAHRDTHTAAVVNRATGEHLGTLEVRAREMGHAQLLAWVLAFDDSERLWAIEDCRVLSSGLERSLLGANERVVRVPPKLMASSRKTVRSFGKSDPIDALAVARAALREPDLPQAQLAGPARELRLLSDHRDDLVQDGTRYQRRLRWHLHELDPDLAPALRGMAKDANLQRLGRQLARMEQSAQVVICRELLRRIRELARRVAELTKQLAGLVRKLNPVLLELPGCGVITAARILAEVDDIGRFANEARLASYAGVAPLDASSGRQQRHRLNRSGNRRLNRALYTIALTQIRVHPPAREYMARRSREGKTTREAMRALKRHLIRTIYRLLTTGGPHRIGQVSASRN